MEKIKVAVTGHRPDKLWWYDLSAEGYSKLRSVLEETLLKIHGRNPDSEMECITGMALGVDTIFALAAIKLKSDPKVKLVCAIPCKYQEVLWHPADKQRYQQIVYQADEVVYVSEEEYKPGCMQKRNQYMMGRADIVIAVWNGDIKGGTADAVKRCVDLNKEMIVINPMEVHR